MLCFLHRPAWDQGHSLILLDSQLLHVYRQRNSIRRLPCHATSLRKLAPKPHYHGGRPPSTVLTTRRVVTDRVCGSDIERCVGRICRGCRSADVQQKKKIPRRDKEGVQTGQLFILPFQIPTHYHYPVPAVQLDMCQRSAQLGLIWFKYKDRRVAMRLSRAIQVAEFVACGEVSRPRGTRWLRFYVFLGFRN